MYRIILRNFQKRIQNVYKTYSFRIQISYRAKKPFTDGNRSNITRNDRGEQRCFRCGQKGHFKRDCMIENVHIYQEEEAEENVNIRQEAKPIIPKAILKRLTLKT